MSTKGMRSARRVDYSRLVTFDLAPSEADHLRRTLRALALIAESVGEPRDPFLDELAQRIDLQLAAIDWPADPARKAPYPV